MPEKILIVDDDLDTIRLVGLMLERQGFEIVASSSGDQVLNLAERQHPDLIVLDIMMPGMDGYEVTRQLRANPLTRDIPILMFTAKSQVDDKLLGLEIGADDFVTKPAQPRQLVAHIQATLERAAKTSVPSSQKEDAAVVGVMAAKGGLGVTTLALNLAIALRAFSKKDVILAEFRNGQSTLGLELGYKNQEGLNRLMSRRPAELSLAEIESEMLSHSSGIRLLLSSSQPRDASFLPTIQSYETIARLLAQSPGYLVVDLGPALTTAAARVLKYCDQVIAVVEPTPHSAAQAKLLLQELFARGFRESQVKLVLINRVRSSIQLSWTQVQEQISQSITTVFTAAPELAYQASIKHTPMFIHQPDSLSAEQFRKLAARLVHAGESTTE